MITPSLPVASCAFSGTVVSRSSGRDTPNRAPSESWIHRLNLDRARRLAALGRWSVVEPGSLNLRIDEEVASWVFSLEAALWESPDSVRYPDGYSDIPKRRQGWRYWEADFFGLLDTDDVAEPLAVLVRRPCSGGVTGIAEVYAPCNLRERFNLVDDDRVSLVVYPGRSRSR